MSFRQTSANAFKSASPQFFVRELQSSQLGLSPEPSPVFSWAIPAALAASAQVKEPPAPPISAIHSHRHAQQLALVLKDILQMQASPSHCPHDQLSQPAPGSLNEFNPSFSQVQFEDYVKELIPALHLVNRAGGLNLAQRQEAIKFAADAVLARTGVGMGWSHALNNRLAISATNFASSEEEEIEFAGQGTVEGGCSSLDEICTLNDDSSCKATSCPAVDDAFEHPDLLAGALKVILPTGRSSEVDDTSETSGVPQLSMVDSTSELVDDEGVCNSHEQNVSQSPLASISIKNSNASVMMPLPGARLSGTSSPPASVDSVVTPESGSTAKDSHIKMLIGAEFFHPQELPGSLDDSVSSNPPDQNAVSAADMELGVSVLGHGGNDGVTTTNYDVDFHDEETVRGDDQNVVRAGMACDKAGEVAGIPYFCAPGMFSVPSGALFAAPATGAVPQEAGYCSSLEKTNMREMIYRVAALQPIDIGREAISRPKRRNVRISKDPQSVAARHRRERISDRIRILQRLVPGGTKMDTASMLDEAIHYVKFLKMQVQALDSLGRSLDYGGGTSWTPFLHRSSSSGYMGCANLYASSDVYQSGVTQAAAGGEKGCSSSSPPCLGASRVDQLQQQSCH